MKTEQKQALFYLLTGFMTGVIATKLVNRIAYETKKAEDEWTAAWERSSSPVDLGKTGKDHDSSESESNRSTDESTEHDNDHD